MQHSKQQTVTIVLTCFSALSSVSTVFSSPVRRAILAVRSSVLPLPAAVVPAACAELVDGPAVCSLVPAVALLPAAPPT